MHYKLIQVSQEHEQLSGHIFQEDTKKLISIHYVKPSEPTANF